MPGMLGPSPHLQAGGGGRRGRKGGGKEGRLMEGIWEGKRERGKGGEKRGREKEKDGMRREKLKRRRKGSLRSDPLPHPFYQACSIKAKMLWRN